MTQQNIPTIYTVQDSQGSTVGVFTDYDKAKECLLGWAESILDNPQVVEERENNINGISQVIAHSEDEQGRFLTKGHTKDYNMGEYTIKAWYKVNTGH